MHENAMSRRDCRGILGRSCRRLRRKHIRLALMVNGIHCVIDRQLHVREPHPGSTGGLLCIGDDGGGGNLVPIVDHVLAAPSIAAERCGYFTSPSCLLPRAPSWGVGAPTVASRSGRPAKIHSLRTTPVTAATPMVVKNQPRHI